MNYGHIYYILIYYIIIVQHFIIYYIINLGEWEHFHKSLVHEIMVPLLLIIKHKRL